MKLTWKVSSAPTGRYRSFSQRAWPTAWHNDHIVASLCCEDEYCPRDVREGNHKPIKVYVYDYSAGIVNRKMKVLIREFPNLAEAKNAAAAYFAKHPEVLPHEV